MTATLADRTTGEEAKDGTPTVEIAAAAAEAIAQSVPGVRRICLYGSVARGEAGPDSDIDLLVVFDDLDYAERKQIAGQCLNAAYDGSIVGEHRVSVVASDEAEWKLRSNLLTSFERAISTDLVEVHRSYAPIPVSNGETDKPVSDLDEAYELINSIRVAYDRAIGAFLPQRKELNLQDDDPDEQLSWYQYDRYVTIVTHTDMVLEISLKSLHHLIGSDPPANSHRLAVLLDGLPSDVIETDKALQAISPLRVDRLPAGEFDSDDLREVFTNWRVHGTYDSVGRASEYLPTERLEAYLDAADQVTDLLMETLRSQTPGGTIRDTPIVNRYRESVEEMRTLRRNHDPATGRQRPSGRAGDCSRFRYLAPFSAEQRKAHNV